MRRRGTGSIYRSQGSWIAAYPLGVVDGKRVIKRARCHSREEARDALQRFQRTYGAGGKAAAGTLDAYLRDWLAHHGPTVRPRTLESYRGHIALHISPLLGGIPVSRLQPDDVRRLIADRLAAGLSPTTVARIVTTLRIALGQGVRDRALPDNPAAAVRLPRAEPLPVRAMTGEQLAQVRNAIRGHPFEPIYLLLMGTGVRVGEALGLDWRDVDLERGTAYIRYGKTARSVRTIHLSRPVLAALNAHHAASQRTAPDDPVFVGPRGGKRIGKDTVNHAFTRLLAAAGLPHLRVHDLRHGFATRALTLGANMRVIADALGHANPATTARVYAHVVPEALRETTDLVGAELG